MTTKEQLIELVIGNEFITKPRLKNLYLTLLDRLDAETKQCDIPLVGCSKPSLGKLVGVVYKGVEYKHNDELDVLVDAKGNVFKAD